MDMPFRRSRTFENLKEAFFEEASLAYRYAYFARVAGFEGQSKLAQLFKEFSEGGDQGVDGCLDFLRIMRDPSSNLPLGGTQANLQSVLQSEIAQAAELYPEMARVAREEGFTDVASWFDTLEKQKHSHRTKMQAALDE